MLLGLRGWAPLNLPTFWLKACTITCLRRICANRYGAPAGTRTAARLKLCHLRGKEALIALNGLNCELVV